jgi:tRNA (mo5U34)-methyltransferase
MVTKKNQPTSREELKSAILSYPRWYHSFQIDSDTKITGWAEIEGAYPKTAFREASFQYYHLPQDWRGKSVIDIGGWDGAISFEMERRGSSRTVLVNPYDLDSMDLPLQGAGDREEIEQKYRSSGYPLTDIHSGGARLLTKWFHSQVEIVDSSVYDLDEKKSRPYDLVLFLGILYHLRDPIRALEIAARLTQELLILETMCFPEQDPLAGKKRAFCEFLGAHTGHNWWCFNFHAIEEMLYTCGFHRAVKKEGWGNRCVYHAYK